MRRMYAALRERIRITGLIVVFQGADDGVFGAYQEESAEIQNAISAAAGRSRYLGSAWSRSTERLEYLAPV